MGRKPNVRPARGLIAAAESAVQHHAATRQRAGPKQPLGQDVLLLVGGATHLSGRSTTVEVIPTYLAEGEQPKYEPTTSLAHLQERFGATLPYLDEALVEPKEPGRG
jgi:hypothetical protein